MTDAQERETAVGLPLVELRNVTKVFRFRSAGPFSERRTVRAVENVSFSIPRGSTFGLVGESGSGKSTIAKMILKLETPTDGSIVFDGEDIFTQNKEAERSYRRSVQAVLQDPYSALSPRLRVSEIIGEPLIAQGLSWRQITARIPHLLDVVGLAADAGDRYPHQFSGGQRQRIAIARALSVEPRLLVLDEPVSALDASIRAQILILLRSMQHEFGLTYLFIGHDLAIVKYISTNVGVMYFGRMVEIGPADEVLRRPLHPYTQKLVTVASMTQPLGKNRLSGELPNPLAPPPGCHFRLRCPFATELCLNEVPRLRRLGNRHDVACHHAEAIEDRAGTKSTQSLPRS